MNPTEARQFVADFGKGDYDPAEHAAFLQWIRGASLSEWEMIADGHEASYDHWIVGGKPSPEWVAAMENRLDGLGVKRTEAPIVPMSFGRKLFSFGVKTWIAAASVVVLIIAGAVWYGQYGISTSRAERQQVLATLTQTMVVARGGELRSITLSDGSKVWLNAASVLKYPSSFSGTERVVELTGEGYFEVTQHSDMPFRVLIRDAEVKVLGTHFNIMAYDDEPVAQTTLIDGSVSVECGSQRVTLHPGEQGEIPYPSPGAVGPVRVIPGIDPSTVLAWKDGFLKFDNTDLRAVMRTLGRCYNVDIQVGQNVPVKTITGVFSRSEGLDLILKQLEHEHLHFINHGRIVTVTLAT